MTEKPKKNNGSFIPLTEKEVEEIVGNNRKPNIDFGINDLKIKITIPANQTGDIWESQWDKSVNVQMVRGTFKFRVTGEEMFYIMHQFTNDKGVMGVFKTNYEKYRIDLQGKLDKISL